MIKLGLIYRLLLILSLCIIINSSFAQRIKPDRWYVSADGGISVFFGDVKRYDYIPDYESPSEIKPMFSANVGKEISKVFSLRGQFLYGGLSGHKKSAHYNFSSLILGAHLLTDINLVYLFTNTRFGNSRFNVLASLGGGFIQWNSTLYYDSPLSDGTDIMNVSNNGSLSFPGSLSIEYLLNKNLSVNIQGMLYVVTSDDVDAKGGGIKSDMINYNSVGVTYKFKTKRKAKRTQINYALDPSIYEPRPKEKEEVAIKETEQQPQTEQPQEIAPVSTQTIEQQKEIAGNHVGEDQFPIDHELEKEAIKKEVWTPKNEDAWPDIVFSVQILASKSHRELAELKQRYNINETIYEKKADSLYKYVVGKYDKLWRAKETRNILRSQVGIEGAFIVVYRNDERISLEEAMNYAARKQTVIAEQDVIDTSEEAAKMIYPLVSLVDNIPKEGTYIGVQILSMKSKEYPMGVFKGIYNIDKPIMVQYKDPWYKLIVYKFSSLNEAYDYQQQVREKGFIDAFVLVYKDGKRISLNKYKELGGK
jgi:hypothetical protein